MLSIKEQKLLDALAPKAEAEHVEIVTIEIVGSKKAPTIRVYIDTESGVSFDELSSAQSWISDMMDEIDPFPGAYTLEVSSPGIDRPLRTPEHFNRFAGSKAVVKTVSPIEGRSSFTGVITEATDDFVALDVPEVGTVQIGFDNVKRAHLQGEIDFSK